MTKKYNSKQWVDILAQYPEKSAIELSRIYGLSRNQIYVQLKQKKKKKKSFWGFLWKNQ